MIPRSPGGPYRRRAVRPSLRPAANRGDRYDCSGFQHRDLADYIAEHDGAAAHRRLPRIFLSAKLLALGFCIFPKSRIMQLALASCCTMSASTPGPLFGPRAGFAAGCAGRRNHRHCALSLGRWRDRKETCRMNSLGRMNNTVCTIELFSQWLLRTATAAGRHILWDNLRRRCG